MWSLGIGKQAQSVKQHGARYHNATELALILCMNVFANGKQASDFKFYVRGIWVPFDSSTINRVLKVQDMKFDEYFPFSHAPFDS
ncbi:hypothetical protein IEQ34_001352 [Dendrobium chrysotoxum]|uniref:Uncharacterized protein n=1 Tax=Dendrobium chrysotoxum TaxID=161865 RepID=A0AAV7HK46_DENCH|nr:hypothetical protein IEQ34_000984 [Dendrobium chrysotoxum]KAH0469794.1 hypothetical protein IEQ34_001352 [Dendrobium chrysotoxum]